MSDKLYYTIPVLAGLVLAQLLSTIFVYQSNLEFFNEALAVKNSGYVSVPNDIVIPTLKTVKAAFSGGLFFTLTSGLFLTLVSITFALVWSSFSKRSRPFEIFIICLWLIFAFSGNMNGICIPASLYLFLIPPVVFFTAVKCIGKKEVSLKGYLLHLVVFILLAIPAAFIIDVNSFGMIRDSFLLTNPVGMAVNKFYYDYTLYAARVFRSNEQKLIKPYRLLSKDGKPFPRRIAKNLLRYDYIETGANFPVSVWLEKEGETLSFFNKGNLILKVSVKKFNMKPSLYLSQFSNITDKFAFFRIITYLSLVSLLCFFLYLCLMISVHLILFLVLKDKKHRHHESAICCFAAGIVCIILFSSFATPVIDVKTMNENLLSYDPAQRLAALQMIYEKKLEINEFPAWEKIAKSKEIPERYWLAMAMGRSRSTETRDVLLSFLNNDESFNVVYISAFALGKRGNRKDISVFLEKIRTSDNWYVQWYLYKALKNLGWKQQKKSK